MKQKERKKQREVAVIGLGYVGLPLAVLAEKRGFHVLGIDINQKRVDSVNARQSPFRDKGLQRALAKTVNFSASSNFDGIKNASTIVICVPTPVDSDRLPDLKPLIGAAKGIGQYLRRGQLVVLESTVNPGVCDEILIPELEKATGLRAGKDFFVAHCPERINPGDESWNVENIPRVVGSLEARGLQLALDFYRQLVRATIRPMSSLKEAEAVKIVENSFRDVNIAFVNELAMSFERLGIDVVRVIEGASTKPFAFMAHYPGCGVGGHCIPVDPYYLIHYASQNGFSHRFLSLARNINEQMPQYVVELLVKGLKAKGQKVAGSKIAVLGLAYKPDIEDDRESPAYEILKELQKKSFKTAVYDPFVAGDSTASLSEALKGAKGVIVATAHSQFRQLQPRDFSKYGIKAVIDGRNCLSADSFAKSNIYFRGIGRR